MNEASIKSCISAKAVEVEVKEMAKIQMNTSRAP